MAKKVTVTLVDDFDGAGAADETVEFGLDGVTYEIDLSTKNAAKLRGDLKQWVAAGRRVGGRRRDVPAPAAVVGRLTASRAQPSANGPAETGTTCRRAAASRPTSSTHSTRPPNKALTGARSQGLGAGSVFAGGEMFTGVRGKRFRGLSRFFSYGSVVTGGFLRRSAAGPNGKAPQGSNPGGPTITVDTRYALSAPVPRTMKYRW